MIQQSLYADLRITASWRSDACRHEEIYYCFNVTLNADEPVLKTRNRYDQLISQGAVNFIVNPGELLPGYSDARKYHIARSTLDIDQQLDTGRYYPAAWFLPSCTDCPQYVRINEQDSEKIVVDLNHPLADIRIQFGIECLSRHDIGGRQTLQQCLLDMLHNGPGMQGCQLLPSYPLDDPMLARLDEQDDSLHYQQPDYEDTFDRVAGRALAELYARFLQPGSSILDIMCGAQSYIPPGIADLHATGIGLNQLELAANTQLQDYRVHNVNKELRLPFDDNSFDAVLFTAAVEYLVSPLKTFAELKRVTRAQGVIVVTFTDHWNSYKNIALWDELPLFERMRLVMYYLLKDDDISDAGTITIRGLKRDSADRYYQEKPQADPVFAVYGRLP